MNEPLIRFMAGVILWAPLTLVVGISLLSLWTSAIHENAISRLTFATTTAALLAALGVTTAMIRTGTAELVLDAGDWIAIDAEAFHFHLAFVFDHLSLPFLLLTLVLCGTVAAFTSRYLHREPGYQRFFLLYSLFTLGMIISCLAGTVEVLFLGWELVGLSSALLVGFFHERPVPVHNGLRVWTVYRLADAAFLLAALSLHHLSGQGDWNRMTGEGTWPYARRC